MTEFFSALFLGVGLVAIVATMVYILGFIVSAIAGLFVSTEESIRHHGHPMPG